MKKSKINGATTVMTKLEFARFMKDKQVFHYEVNWIEKWSMDVIKENYFPYKGFVMKADVKLAHYGYGYSEKCFASHTVKGRNIYSMDMWKVSLNKRNNRWYVTKCEKWRSR